MANPEPGQTCALVGVLEGSREGVPASLCCSVPGAWHPGLSLRALHTLCLLLFHFSVASGTESALWDLRRESLPQQHPTAICIQPSHGYLQYVFAY